MVENGLKTENEGPELTHHIDDLARLILLPGSIFGPLLFNTYICDMFFESRDLDIASYADSNTPYRCSQEMNDILKTLENEANKLFDWVQSNYLKSNISKCHLLSSLNSPVELQISNEPIMSENI